MAKKRFLFVSPHPDDADLGIGGTIIKLCQQKHKVMIVDLTSGEPTPFGSEVKRKKETAKANIILGGPKRLNLDLTNRYLFDSKQARLLLAEQIRVFRPDILFCPYPQDAHPDHLAAAKITEGARFYAKYTKTDLKAQPHYPPYLFYYFCSHLRIIPELSFCVDISQQFQQKMKAVKCYHSQFIKNQKNKFIFEYLITPNRYLGTLSRCRYAEGLYVKEAVNAGDLSVFK